jgi:hypothetical protein
MDDSNAVGNTDMGLGLMEMRSNERRGRKKGRRKKRLLLSSSEMS